MALKKEFYNEIFQNEQKWIELINLNLLNSIYCNLTLKPFYIEKKKELENEYLITNNKIIGQILLVIDEIINNIENLHSQYIKNENVDLTTLLPLFLINQMNNTIQKDNREIKNIGYNSNILKDNDYIYDDFPEEQIRVK